MEYRIFIAKLKTYTTNRSGFTFLSAIFLVMLVGIMSAFTGKSWTTIMKREREKELLFRGSQIKEAIENWYDIKYTVGGNLPRARVLPLIELDQLLKTETTATPLRFLPHSYATKLTATPKCGSDCAKDKLHQDPITGKEWTLIRDAGANGLPPECKRVPNGCIIGVASKSDDFALKTDFKDTALEGLGSTNTISVNLPRDINEFKTRESSTNPVPTEGVKNLKYSDWKFQYDQKNDHKKIFRAYHEGL